MIYPSEVGLAIEALEKNGFEAYIVGGCLRNILMGKEPNDWDMTTSALPEKTGEIFRSMGYNVIETGLKHGTVTAVINGVPLEITTFRIDGEYTDSRHPDCVTFTRSLSEDLARRDFTVNAMAYSEKTGLVDIYGGKEDLEGRVLRAVGEPKKRFTEDALRILRAFRFSSEHGFFIEEATRAGMAECRGGLRDISAERIYSELCRTLKGDFASRAVEDMIQLGIFEFVFREYQSSYAPPFEIIDRLPKRLAPRLACLLMSFPDQKTERTINFLKMSNSEKKSVKQVISAVKRLRENNFEDIISARRFIRSYGEICHDAVELAFYMGINVEGPKEMIKKALSEKFPVNVGDLDIRGDEVISLGASGRLTGEVLAFLLERATVDPSLNKRSDLIELAKKYILENKK